MTLTLKLPPELEQRLTEQSERKHLSVNDYAIQLLDQSSTIPEKNKQAIALLQSWIDAPPEEIEEEEQAEQRITAESEKSSALPESDIPISERNKRAIALLQSWIDASEEEIAEQKETWEFLVRALDEDRTSDRKLFPPELKGISW